MASAAPGQELTRNFFFKQQLPSRWYAGAPPAILKQELPGIGQELTRNFFFKQQLPAIEQQLSANFFEQELSGIGQELTRNYFLNSNYQQLNSNCQQFLFL